MSAHQTKQLLILGTWMEHPANGSQQEVLEHFFHIVALVCPQKVMQAGSYSGLAVPHQTVQHILNRVIEVFVCHDGERHHQLLFAGQAAVLIKVKEQIFDIGIGQGLLRQPRSRTMSTWSVNRFSQIAPHKSGSQTNTVRQFPIVLAGCPFSVTERLPRTCSTVNFTLSAYRVTGTKL